MESVIFDPAPLDFTQIANNILYACGAGSKITDSMGKGESYDFDFVPGTATVSVGTEQLEVTRESENTWSFHSTGSTSPRFTLTYDADADAYEFTAHEAISNFAPVKLTYDVALAKAPAEPGDYELATNTKATLTRSLPANVAGKRPRRPALPQFLSVSWKPGSSWRAARSTTPLRVTPSVFAVSGFSFSSL